MPCCLSVPSTVDRDNETCVPMSVTNSVVKKEAAASPAASVEAMEMLAQQTYRPPGHPHMTPGQPTPDQHEVEWVRNTDGTPLVDHKGRPITVDRMLATKPLRGELSTRPGPGNRKLTYLSGEGVTRTLNDIFGFDGWNLDIKQTQREVRSNLSRVSYRLLRLLILSSFHLAPCKECVKDDKNRFHLAYTATVRLTHRKSGAYKEDCGAGDAIDRSMGTAVANALKASITDAMKRAARHFGDKLGNCTLYVMSSCLFMSVSVVSTRGLTSPCFYCSRVALYQGNFSINSAPNSLQEALDQYEIQRAKTKFGFPKDQAVATKSDKELAANMGVTIDNIPASAVKAGGPATKHPEPTKPKAPVPPFNSNAASMSVNAAAAKTMNPHASQTPKTVNPRVSQTPGVYNAGKHVSITPGVPSTSKSVVSAERSRAPDAPQVPSFAGREQPPQSTASHPPPTATQVLQSSALFKLSTFTAGKNTMQSGPMPAATFDENIPPIDFDALDRERPSTSTGHKQPAIGALQGHFSAGKRSLDEVTESQSYQARKIPNLNPYLSS